MTASHDFGPVLVPAIRFVSTTDITLVKPLPKPKAHTTDEVDYDKLGKKRSRKLKTKLRDWSTRRCHRGREQQHSKVCQVWYKLRRVKTGRVQVAHNYQALVVHQHPIQ
jgi:hypothetical protein